MTYNPADFRFGGEYMLTTYPDRMKQFVDANTGEMTAMEDRNENRLTFTKDAIVSNRGRQVTFLRDQRGNITQIVDPRKNALRYEYDSAGNLTKFYDRINSVARTNPVQFTYVDNLPHYLDEIIDPYGRETVKNTYSPEGRLQGMTDASGATVGLAYNLTTRTQTITDQLGKSGQVQLDEKGNIIRETDQLGQTTLRTFVTGSDGITYPASETQVIGLPDNTSNLETNDLTTTWQYSFYGSNPPRMVRKVETDAQGNSSIESIDYRTGAPVSQTDAFGNTTFSSFDDKGNLTSMRDANGNATSIQYDKHGNATRITQGEPSYSFGSGFGMGPGTGGTGNTSLTTQMVYNQFGDLITTIDPYENQRSISYDENGNQFGTTSVWTNADNPDDQRTVPTSTILDANDRATSSTSPTGTSHTDYDFLNRPFRTTDQYDRVNETVYDKRGLTIENRSEGTDENNNTVWLVSQTVYDAAGRATYSTSSYPAGTPAAEITGTHTVYDDVGRAISTEQLLGLTIAITGTPGNLSASIATLGTVITTSSTTYEDGRVTETTNTYSLQNRTLYDRFGRVVEFRSETLSTNGVLSWLVSRTIFDELGRAVVSTDRFLVPGNTPLNKRR